MSGRAWGKREVGVDVKWYSLIDGAGERRRDRVCERNSKRAPETRVEEGRGGGGGESHCQKIALLVWWLVYLLGSSFLFVVLLAVFFPLLLMLTLLPRSSPHHSGCPPFSVISTLYISWASSTCLKARTLHFDSTWYFIRLGLISLLTQEKACFLACFLVSWYVEGKSPFGEKKWA